jgi:DNA polymerase I-like protein with 3'-5' exonuclease and polymerase domains
MKFDTHIIKTEEQLEEFFAYVDDSFEEMVMDTETTGLNEKTALLYGIGLCFRDEEAFYIPWRTWDEENQQHNLYWSASMLTRLTAKLDEWHNKYKVVGHNLSYDYLILKNNLGIDCINNLYHDTVLSKHLIEEEPPHSLKPTSVKYLGDWADKAQQDLYDNIKANGGKTTQKCTEFFKADMDMLGEYCCWDVILTYKLFKLFHGKLEEQGLLEFYYDVESMPLYREVTIPMKDKGFPVDLTHFNQVKSDLERDLNLIEDEIMAAISNTIEPFIEKTLNEKYPAKTNGKFPKILAEVLEIPLPKTKSGTVSLSKAAITKQAALATDLEQCKFYSWILKNPDKPCPFRQDIIREVQERMFFSVKANENNRYVFNISSGVHLAWLFFDALGIKCKNFTDSGKPSTDAESLEALAGQHEFVDNILEYKKLYKLYSTYICGILDRQTDGVIHTDMLQFGTTSGRFSSRNPNLQNLPRIKDDDSIPARVKKYTKAIKQGFVAGDGRKIVNADWSALEPRIFAHTSQEDRLIGVYESGEDLYSRVAIDVFGLTGVSAKESDSNYLKKVNPEFRQKAKVFCLAVVYGANAGKISEVMKVEYQEADRIIKAYLNAYPKLKKYITDCHYAAKRKGFVKAESGRIRHLPKAKQLYDKHGSLLTNRTKCKIGKRLNLYYEFRNYLNNSTNFPIQGMASYVCNQSMLATARALKKAGLSDAYVALQVHDEITVLCDEKNTDKVLDILRDSMENTIKLSVPLIAEPLVGDRLSEAK